MRDEDGTQLLTEIRDAQRQLVDEYRRATTESLAIQRRSLEIQESAAVAMQTSLGRLYRIVIGVAAILVGAVLVFLAMRA
jgi:type IV pilus biogenesis protein CpaD/CtpE